MSAWKTDELESISGVDEVQVASRRTDGSLRPFVTIWAVRHGDDVYVRSAHGPKNGWFVRAVAPAKERFYAGRVERDITFERPDPSVDAGVDGGLSREVRPLWPEHRWDSRRAGGRPAHTSARAGIGARASAYRARSPRVPDRGGQAVDRFVNPPVKALRERCGTMPKRVIRSG